MYAPITLFTYARLEHTRRSVEALLRNRFATESDLIVFSDAARTPEKRSDVEEVRAYLNTLKGFRTVTIHHRSRNFGLAESIIQGVTEVLEQYERVIVLEDDLITSPYFLTYMNKALDLYGEEEKVISIHGYVYPVQIVLPETFFLRGADCWGWGTWRRGWNLFNSDGSFLLNELKKFKQTYRFDFNGSYPYTRMLEDQISGRNDSWAIRWYASAFLADKLTLYPSRSLVYHMGNDGSGMNFGESSWLDSTLSETPIDLSQAVVEPSISAWNAFEAFFRQKKGGPFLRLFRGFLSALR